MPRKRQTLAILLAGIAICLVLLVVETQTKAIHRLYDERVLDNRNHCLPCDRLPTEAEARQVLEQHADVVQAIEQVNPGFVKVEIDTYTCPGRADLVIWYPSHANRMAIEGLIGGNTFFGVPCRLRNF